MPITESDLAELLSIEEAASVLGISRSAMYRIVERREVDVVRLGGTSGRMRVTRRALLDYVNRRVTPADRPKPARRRRDDVA